MLQEGSIEQATKFLVSPIALLKMRNTKSFFKPTFMKKTLLGVIKLREGVEALEKRLKAEEKRGKKIVPVNVKILVDNQSGLVGTVLDKSGMLLKCLLKESQVMTSTDSVLKGSLIKST